MTVHRQRPEPSETVAVGDPIRPVIKRAVFGTLLASAIFFVFFVPTKQIHMLYNHAPWEDDPFDAVYSFTMLFVPLVAACVLVPVSLCRRSEPLSVSRVLAILRGCRVALGSMVIALLTDWVALALEANRSQWTDRATGTLVGLLLISTIVTGKVIIELRRVPELRSPEPAENVRASDWLADAVTVAERESHWLGPLRRPGLSVLSWIDRSLLSEVRRHPLVAAGAASGIFGVTVLGNQAIKEGYSVSAALITMALGTCGMFAFVVLAGSYVGLVQNSTPLRGARRRAVDAAVTACIAAVTALAFRNSLWWIVGSRGSVAGIPQFASLLAVVAFSVFVATFTAESLLRSHSRAASTHVP